MKIRHIALLLAIVITACAIGMSGYRLKTQILAPLELSEYLEKSIFELPFLAYVDDELMFYIEYADEFLSELTEPKPSTDPELPTTVPTATPSVTLPTQSQTQPTQTAGTDSTQTQPSQTVPTVTETEPPTTVKPTEPKPTEPKPSAEPTFDFPADRVDDSWYDNALFIGNSQMNGLAHYARAGNAHYFAKDAMTFISVFKKELSDKDNFKNKTLEQLLSEHQYDKIIINFGFNEAGAGGYKWFCTRFDQFMQKIRAWQPEAKIIINCIMPVSRDFIESRGEAGSCWKPSNLQKLNGFFKSYENGKDTFFIDSTAYFGDKEGYLFDSITNDGIHLKVKYYKVWRDWMSYAFSTLGI